MNDWRPALDIQRHRIAPAKVGVAVVKRMPIGRCEEVALVIRAMQIWRKADDSLAVAPCRCPECIAGGHEQRLLRNCDPPGRPDPAAPAARGPGDQSFRVMERYADHPAMVIPAIAEMAAKRHIQRPVEYGQGAALVLVAGVEALVFGPQRIGDINRPARQRRAVLKRQSKNPVMRTG